MSENNYSNYDTLGQIAEQKNKDSERDQRVIYLKILCDQYSVFLRSDLYDKSDLGKTIETQSEHVWGIANAAMGVFHPGTQKFIDFLATEKLEVE